MELFIPPWVRISGGRYDWLSNTAAFPSTFTGSIRSTDRLGDRVMVNFSTENANHDETSPTRSVLSTLRASMRGQLGKVWYTDSGYAPRGSFPDSELLTNNTFANGITGWSTGSSANVAVSAANRILRSRRVSSASSTTVRTSATTTTAYMPYVARAMIVNGRGGIGNHGCRMGTTAGGNDVSSTGTISGQGLSISAGVSQGTSTFFSILDSISGSRVAGDYLDIPYTSLSQCALIDNGPNLLLRSDQLGDTSAWGATTSNGLSNVVNNGTTAPDGSVTAESLVEDSANSTHLRQQSVTAAADTADFSFACALKAGARTWGRLEVGDTTHAVYAYFNLSTGAVGTVSSQGANMINQRAFIAPMGDGWYYCCIIGRKTSSSTTVRTRIYLASADNTITYTGDGTSNVFAWRATLAQSGVPTRLAQTTTAAISSGASQTGPGYHTKGWPASTSGLLLPDDWVQIGNQLNKVVASVDSDAAGLAYLQLAYPLRSAPSDNAPVIIHEPFGRFVSVSNEGGYNFNPDGSSHEFSLVEDLAA